MSTMKGVRITDEYFTSGEWLDEYLTAIQEMNRRYRVRFDKDALIENIRGNNGNQNSFDRYFTVKEMDSTHAVFEFGRWNKCTIHVERNRLVCEWNGTHLDLGKERKYSIEYVKGENGSITLNSESVCDILHKEQDQESDQFLIGLINNNLLNFGTLDLNSIGSPFSEVRVRNEGRPEYFLYYKPGEDDGIYLACKSLKSGPIDKSRRGMVDYIQFIIRTDMTCGLSYVQYYTPLIGHQHNRISDAIPNSDEFDLQKLTQLIQYTLDNGGKFRYGDERSKKLYEDIQTSLREQAVVE